jgi:8-oxo-dGTP diphosphatase
MIQSKRMTILVPFYEETGMEKQVLLGFGRPDKKIGAEKWSPPGGGFDRGRDNTTAECAVRETREETDLFFFPKDLRQHGLLNGFRTVDGKLTLVTIVYVYSALSLSSEFKMNRSEYTDMGWFPVSEIPWKHMMMSDHEWLPLVIQGQSFGTVDVNLDSA